MRYVFFLPESASLSERLVPRDLRVGLLQLDVGFQFFTPGLLLFIGSFPIFA